jgi:hypothetical protein
VVTEVYQGFGNTPTCGIFVVHFIINIRLFKMIITENLTVREKIDIPKKSYRDWIRQRCNIVRSSVILLLPLFTIAAHTRIYIYIYIYVYI